MTTTDERWRSFQHAQEFLEDIVSRKRISRKDMRDRAQIILRHYPGQLERYLMQEGKM